MDKKNVTFWGVVLLIGLMLTACAGNYGAHGYSDYPYYDQGHGYYAPNWNKNGGW